MEFKGTKGEEWKIEESFDKKYDQKIFNISTSTVEGIAVCFSGGRYWEEEQLANAKLISSAPENTIEHQNCKNLLKMILSTDSLKNSELKGEILQQIEISEKAINKALK